MAQSLTFTHDWRGPESWPGLLLLIDDLARCPLIAAGEVDAYVEICKWRLGDRDETHALPPPVVTLSPRQTECLQRASLGESVATIAAAMGVKPSTVHKWNDGIRAKLSARTLSHAVAIAWRACIID